MTTPTHLRAELHLFMYQSLLFLARENATDGSLWGAPGPASVPVAMLHGAGAGRLVGGCTFKYVDSPPPQQLALSLGGVGPPPSAVGASSWGGHDPPASTWRYVTGGHVC